MTDKYSAETNDGRAGISGKCRIQHGRNEGTAKTGRDQGSFRFDQACATSIFLPPQTESIYINAATTTCAVLLAPNPGCSPLSKKTLSVSRERSHLRSRRSSVDRSIRLRTDDLSVFRREGVSRPSVPSPRNKIKMSKFRNSVNGDIPKRER